MEQLVRPVAFAAQSAIAALRPAGRPHDANPVAPIKVSSLSSPKSLFGLALLVVTAMPYVVIALQFILPGFVVLSVQEVTFFLGGIHVPLTAYLFFDPKIRSYMRHRPIELIVGPILIFAICFFVFLSTWESRLAGEAWPLVYFMLGAIAWSYWHFGKQNVGVYSFFRHSQSQPGLGHIERKLILIGTILGVLATFIPAGYVAGYIDLYSKNSTSFSPLTIAGHITPFLKYGQYALLVVVAAYLALNWQRYTWKSAAMLFLCANFFFPINAAVDMPAAFNAVAACSVLSHGVQYCVFLGFHAAQYRPDSNERGVPPPRGRAGSLVMCGILIVMAVFLGESFLYNSYLPKDLFSKVTTHALGRDDILVPVAESIGTGIWLTHFWLDSFFWRFKNPEARQWMTKRYAFLFNSGDSKRH
jgi:hypothetical protein